MESEYIEAVAVADDPYGRKAPFKEGDEVTIIVGQSARRYVLSDVQRNHDGSARVTLQPRG